MWRRAGTTPFLVVVAAAVFVACFWRVLAGDRVLMGGDILYACCLPWGASSTAHPAANVIVGDPVLQFLPWQGLVQDALLHLRLPLWDPYALGGKPLLANDQAAPFSPFTWIAVPFPPAVGLSLAMLAKLWVAGAGMWLYLRQLRLSPVARFAGAAGYAASGYMVAWLAWPHTAVAAVLPWVFAAVEWYLEAGTLLAVAAVAATVALQFLAGHAETSLHIGLGLSLYSLVRSAAAGPGRLAGLAAAAVLGTILAGAQLVPFLVELQHASLISDRAQQHMGAGHLGLGALGSWLVPNGRGDPGIDQLLGRPPNFNESTGFATVTMLLLSPVGLINLARKAPTRALALAVMGVVAAGVVYGPLSPLAGITPGLSVSANGRMLVLIGFAVAALGAAGIDWVAARTADRRGPRWLVAAAWLALAAEAAGALAFAVFTLRLVHRLGNLPGGYETYWTGMALVAAAACVLLGLALGVGHRPALNGLAALVLIEAALFAVPFQPQVARADVPPASRAIDSLKATAGSGETLGLGGVAPPESLTLYGLRDMRGYDVVSEPRVRVFWPAADPGFRSEALTTVMERPGLAWLQAAGVTAVLAATSAPAPDGLVPVDSTDGVTVYRVPDARPYAFVPGAWVGASDPAGAVAAITADPSGPVAIEGAAPGTSGGGAVSVTARRAGEIVLDADLPEGAPVVVLESFAPGWRAEVDGRAAQVRPADVLFMAVSVPSGRHRVVLTYAPAAVREGVLASTAGVLLLLALLAFRAVGANRRADRPGARGRYREPRLPR